MKIKELMMRHFVKGEDLNHHGTLYAGDYEQRLHDEAEMLMEEAKNAKSHS